MSKQNVEPPLAGRRVEPLVGHHFRGVLWPRGEVNGQHRCIVIGVLVSDIPFDLPNQAIVNTDGAALRLAVDSMEFRESAIGLGTASDVLCRLNREPFVDDFDY